MHANFARLRADHQLFPSASVKHTCCRTIPAESVIYRETRANFWLFRRAPIWGSGFRQNPAFRFNLSAKPRWLFRGRRGEANFWLAEFIPADQPMRKAKTERGAQLLPAACDGTHLKNGKKNAKMTGGTDTQSIFKLAFPWQRFGLPFIVKKFHKNRKKNFGE